MTEDYMLGFADGWISKTVYYISTAAAAFIIGLLLGMAI